jgi:hypothetical protein
MFRWHHNLRYSYVSSHSLQDLTHCQTITANSRQLQTKKKKFALEQNMKSQRGSRGRDLLFLQPQRHVTVALPLEKKTRYPLYRRLGGPQGRSGWSRKISPPPGFDPRTVQPVASRYTDSAIPSNNRSKY